MKIEWLDIGTLYSLYISSELRKLGLRQCRVCREVKKIRAFYPRKIYESNKCKHCADVRTRELKERERELEKKYLGDRYIRRYLSRKTGRSFLTPISWRSNNDRKTVVLQRTVLEARKYITYENKQIKSRPIQRPC